jgi:hypothetical protein
MHITDEQIGCSPKAWSELCRNMGWGRHRVPREIAERRRRAQGRKRIVAYRNSTKTIDALKARVVELERENERLQKNLDYAAAENRSAYDRLFAALGKKKKKAS